MVFTAFRYLTVETFHTTFSSDGHMEIVSTQRILGAALLLQIQNQNEGVYIDVQMWGYILSAAVFVLHQLYLKFDTESQDELSLPARSTCSLLI